MDTNGQTDSTHITRHPLPLPSYSIYRQAWHPGFFVAFVGGALALAGLGFSALGPDWQTNVFGLIWTAFCVFFVFAGFAIIFGSIAVDQIGIHRKVAGLWTTTYVWADIAAWMVVHSAIESQRAARQKLFPEKSDFFTPLCLDDESKTRGVFIRLKGKGGPVVVPEAEVYRPGFDLFVNDVRSFAAAKEVLS